MNSDKALPILKDNEIRVLGALIEKSKITPDYYPMTLHGLTAACNQKTSRRPVVDYDEQMVMDAINSLKGISLVSTSIGGGSRAVKYKHNFLTVYPVSEAELAILCLLFLRGPQTPGELNTNSGRLYEFESIEEINACLKKLVEGADPFVIELPKQPGKKETRFMHLFGESLVVAEQEFREEELVHNTNALESRITALEEELEEVKATLARVMQELFGT